MRKRILCSFASILLIFMVLCSTSAFAVSVDNNRTTSLTVSCQNDGIAVEGLELSLYKIADIDNKGDFKAVSQLIKYDFDLGNLTDNNIEDITNVIAGYVLQDNLTACDRKASDINGKVLFTDIPQGLYMVMGDVKELTDGFYIPKSFLVSLPSYANKSVSYDVDAILKYTLEKKNEKKKLKVFLTWNDNNSKSRPKSVTVYLFEDGVKADEQVLSEEDNWTYTWENLSPGHIRYVSEKDIPPDYTVSTEINNDVIRIDNVKETTPSKPEKKEDEKLPQTGMLWWPVMAFAVSGLALFMIGWLLKRSDEY